ncbi:Replication termination factor 2, partial [Coemansia asiatica]
QSLEQPIVGNGLGHLYNQEALLEYLFDNSKFENENAFCTHIKVLKDVKILRRHPNTLPSNVS